MKSSDNFYQELSAALAAHRIYFQQAEDAYNLFNRVNDTALAADYNLLKQVVRIVRPTLFHKLPVLNIKRRFSESNKIDLIVAQSIKLLLQYNADCSAIQNTLKKCLTDLLVVGRAVVWVSYDFESKDSILTKEVAQVDRVLYSDFLHSAAQNWQQVSWVARAIFPTREELKDKFGASKADLDKLSFYTNPERERITQRTFTYEEEGHKDYARTRLWEVWDKQDGVVKFFCSDTSQRELVSFGNTPPPVNFEGFFPCPEPLCVATGADDLIPIPDFEYLRKDQRRLDTVCRNIAEIESLIRPVSLHDKRVSPELKSLFKANTPTLTFPVDNLSTQWEKQEQLLQFLPLEIFVAALQEQRANRDDILKNAFEKSGIADIMRGISDPQDAQGTIAQKQKNSTGFVREIREDFERFVRDIYELQAEVVCEAFSDEHIVKVCDFPPPPPPIPLYPPEVVQANPQLQQQIQIITAQHQEHQEYMQALQLMRDGKTREYRIDIENNSTLAVDEEEEKRLAIEFTNVIQQFVPLLIGLRKEAPELLPILPKLVQTSIKKFSQGQELESDIEKTMQDLVASSQQLAQQQQQQALQMQQQEMQLRAEKQQSEIAIAQESQRQKALELEVSKLALENDRLRVEIEKNRMQVDAAKTEGDLAIKRGELVVKETQTAADIRDADADNKREDKKLELQRNAQTIQIR